MNEAKVSIDDDKERDEHKQIKVDEPYDYLPQDRDLCAHIAIETYLGKELLVKIDGSFVLQNQLLCLLDEKGWVNDDVMSAYICCLKDQVHVQNDSKVYFETPFVVALLKRDGNLGVQQDGTFMTEIVNNYVKHDMIELPINFNNKHWYLAVLIAKKCEIQVLDSLCWKFDREDLVVTESMGAQLETKTMFDNIKTAKKRRGLIAKHYLDMKFWMITDFRRHLDYRKKLDVEQLAFSDSS
ncbi:hypothetical protein D1007_14252 [Hordeum vulgare]|nr:hypothetical protein D1007_14252 [Hordeum vulgare]